MVVTGENRSSQRKPFPSANFSGKRPTLSGLGSNSVLRGEKATTMRLSHWHGRAYCGHAGHCNMTMLRGTLKVTSRFAETLNILSSRRPCFYLCTISRSRRSLKYRRCCTIRQSRRSEPALRLWCAALLSSRPFSYQWRPCVHVRRPLCAASVISETRGKRIREFCERERLKARLMLRVDCSECLLRPQYSASEIVTKWCKKFCA
jgi:hypothetical protein